MATVFISYRRGDSSGHTGRLFDRLEQRFGRSAFFRDLESLEYGIDFPAEVEKALAVCSVVLVVIGPGWLNAQAKGQRRLDQAHDFVRIEVAAALARPDVRTIPVLVGDAQVPSEDELPDVLKLLASRNGIEVSDSRWDYDVNKLGNALARAGLTDSASGSTAAPTDNKVGRFSKRAVFGLAAAGVLGIGAVATGVGGADEDHSEERSPTNQNAVVPPPDTVEEHGTEGSPVDQNAAVPPPDTVDHGGLTWTVNSSRHDLNWNEAVAFCNRRGSGWRMPTIGELRTIADTKSGWEIQVLAPFVDGVSSRRIWSSQTDSEGDYLAYDFTTLKQVPLAIGWKGDVEALCVLKGQN